MTKTSLDYAIEHREIIHQFGRFPHRNLILDRPSNAQEIEWLGDHGNRFGQG